MLELCGVKRPSAPVSAGRGEWREPDANAGHAWSSTSSAGGESWRLVAMTLVQGVTTQKHLRVSHLLLARLLRSDVFVAR